MLLIGHNPHKYPMWERTVTVWGEIRPDGSQSRTGASQPSAATQPERCSTQSHLTTARSSTSRHWNEDPCPVQPLCTCYERLNLRAARGELEPPRRGWSDEWRHAGSSVIVARRCHELTTAASNAVPSTTGGGGRGGRDMMPLRAAISPAMRGVVRRFISGESCMPPQFWARMSILGFSCRYWGTQCMARVLPWDIQVAYYVVCSQFKWHCGNYSGLHHHAKV